MTFQTVSILVLLECTLRTLTLAFLYLAYLISNYKSILNWNVDLWLKANKLSLKVAKTELMIISSRQKLLSLNDYTINNDIDSVQVNQTTQSKSLGLNIDDLSWKAHLHDVLNKKGSSRIGALKRIRLFVSVYTAVLKYQGLIEPHFDYCSAVWNGLSQHLKSDKLQNLQHRTVRVITVSRYDTSSRQRLDLLGWDNLSIRNAKQLRLT